MKAQIILFVAICLGVARSFYVNGIEDDDLLERALEKDLFPLGVRDVDVDDIFLQTGAYRVTLESNTVLHDSEGILQKALHNLGFIDAKIEVVSLGEKGWFGKIKDRFVVYLNKSTYRKIMESFAPNFAGLFRHSGEDSRDWD